MPIQSNVSRRAVLGAGLAAVFGAGGLVAAPGVAAAKAEPIHTGRFSDLAAGGYDPVAYFKEGKPAEGSRQFSTQWHGATWRFASRENLDAFKADPQLYAPQYGGYCAWAVAQDKLAPGNPKYWRIVDGKLYLNYDRNVQETWEKDIPGFIAKADGHWPSILDRH